MKYDVIIVGCGPAGIFSAYELSERTNLKILMLDKGPDLDKRKCPASRGIGCLKCNPCFLLSGWGGAGAFSDGKLTLSTEVGGWLNEYLPNSEFKSYIDYVDNIYLKFEAPNKLYGTEIDKIDEIERKATLAGLRLIYSKIRHLGTDECIKILHRIKQFLNKKGVEIRTNTEVKGLLVKNGKVEGVKTAKGEEIFGKYIIVAPGRGGAEWLASEAQLLGLKKLNNPVDIGVRVEVPAPVLEELTNVL
ncbi:MAG: FAD-dependent oxidoreductase, partial [Candidatus Bathyarchaeia archaeon]